MGIKEENDKELIRRAFRAWFSERSSVTVKDTTMSKVFRPDMPTSGEVVGNGGHTYVILRGDRKSITATRAVYRLKNDMSLKRLRRFPRTVQ